MTFLNSEVATEDGISNKGKKLIQNLIKLGNFVIGLFGILIFLYSAWMLMYCLKNYHQDLFSSWFLWACMGVGCIFCLIASLGRSAAATRRSFVLSFYIEFMFLLLLTEGLIIADVALNKQWKKDFPLDPTQRFEGFLAYFETHSAVFKLFGFILIISQVASFFLALFLRTMYARVESQHYDVASVPFLDHHIMDIPYVVGHPLPAPY